MKNYEKSKTRLLESLIRNIVNEVIHKIDPDKLVESGQSFLSKTKERFRFNDERDLRFFNSSLDTIGDSQFAIIGFLGKKTKDKKQFNEDENYLSLYGLLSAIYIQQKAISKLMYLVDINQLDEKSKQLKNLDIIYLRNCISAHPTDFELSKTNKELGIKSTSFRIVRNSIKDFGNIVVMDEWNKQHKYNIYNLTKEFTKMAETYLYEIGIKLVSNAFKSAETKMNELQQQLDKIFNTNNNSNG